MAAANATYALELRDLRKSFGKTEIIRGANLAVAPGERVAQLTRWTFSADKAINYVRFVMRERLVQTPFGG